ncbi:hypothetical protein D9M69_429110 [compost metagenome]
MRRKPSASHWVKKLPLDTYRPDSVVLAAGWHAVVISSEPCAGSPGMVSVPASWVALATGFPSRLTPTSSSSSPHSTSGASSAAPGWRAKRSVLVTTVRWGSRSSTRSAWSMAKGGAV